MIEDFMEPTEYSFEEQLKTAKPLTKKVMCELKGKPFYDEYKEGDVVLFLMIEKNMGRENGFDQITMKIESIVKRTLHILENEYDFVRLANKFPVFKKKEGKNGPEVEIR